MKWGFFGPVHIATLVLAALMNVGLYFALKKASQKVQTWVLGILMERYTPNIILPVFLLMCGLSLVAILTLPDPGPRKLRESGRKVSYIEMLRSNPTLVLLLCACILAGMGQCAGSTFLIRVVENWAAPRKSWDWPCSSRPVWSCPPCSPPPGCSSVFLPVYC